MRKKLGITLACLTAFGAVTAGISSLISAPSVYAESVKNEEKTANFTTKTVENNDKQSNIHCRAKSAYLMDYNSGTVIFSQKERERLPIASMCKIMTLVLCFDAIKSGNLTFDEEIQISENASSMGGSQVFLEANAKYPVSELIKSIVVCSANDSCVAMAERISGSESAFVDALNERAKSLGCNDTLFANCTGLPKEPQYSCAKDVAFMLRELLKNPKYFDFSKVWIDKFQHHEGRFTEITNTNKLVRFYDGCDGGKTGFTNQAGFCLASTAKRDKMRLISVVIGEETSANRFEDSKAMFNYAFANYTVTPLVEESKPIDEIGVVSGGKEKNVKLAPLRSSYAFLKRGDKAKISLQTIVYPLRAPVSKGQTAGEIIVYKEGVEIDKIPLIAVEQVEKAGFTDRFRDIANSWNSRK